MSSLPDGFYKPLSSCVTPMKKLKKSIRVNEVDVIDTSLIYSRVIALQLTNEALTIENIFCYELSPIPTSMFEDKGAMKLAKSKSNFSKLATKVSSRSIAKPSLLVIDGCAILWVVNWPTNGLVSDYVKNFCDFIFLPLKFLRLYFSTSSCSGCNSCF